MKISEIQAWVKAQFAAYTKKMMAWANGKFALKTAVPSADEIAKYFNAAPIYNSESKKIEFYHDSTKVAELDATAFIKDGMVNTVSITDGKTDGPNTGKKVLLITFNTDSGKEDIELALDGIFNAANYYTKTDADSTFVKNSDWESKTADFAKSEDVYSKEDADSTFVKNADLTDITDEEWNAMFAES